MGKDFRLCVAMEQSFYALVKMKAQESGLSVSGYVRYAVKKFMESESQIVRRADK